MTLLEDAAESLQEKVVVTLKFYARQVGESVS